MNELNALQIFTTVLSGTFVGSLQDPSFLIILLASLCAGFAARKSWVVLLIAAGAAAIRIAVAFPTGSPLFSYILLAIGTIFLMAASVGYVVRRLAAAASDG
ncbi:hypothetical protein JYU29_05125 [Tianweitania sp. BSSL-BM11]|uniref:GDT1 family protein n=1 Tax=Tianweitania aestuarii TaxID=2814886 RepID=A0ABS5RSP4_9HYPH|nr:hypothetical protein [Tianweitania aestuarii]MBS9720069.1 hypothetical protein [Tianweitania aestuarii]